MADPISSPRDLVVCCDGTNNTLTAGVQDTNVLQLYDYLRRYPSPRRLLYYDPGVGAPDVLPPTDPIDWASRAWERISGLASGRGVYDNVAQAYLFLMQNWRDDRDRIYCFGFSRGAFTVRCVVGMVNLFGILKPEHDVLLPTLIRVYFSMPGDRDGWFLQRATRWVHDAAGKKSKAAAEVAGAHAEPAEEGKGKGAGPKDTRKALAYQIRTLFTTEGGAAAEIHWVGVWDTVDSVGLPGPLSRSNPSAATLRGKRVRNARHALAFDEHRWTFEPRPYEEPGDIADGGQTLRQRWFPGVHCDVGGSYLRGEAGLAEESLEWMVNEVAADLDIPPLPPCPLPRLRHDAIWDTPWWALAGMCLRNMRPEMTAPARVERFASERQPQPIAPVRADASRARSAPPAKVPIAVIPAGDTRRPTASVWERRRPLWPVAAAILIGLACLVFSGACLTSEGGQRLWHLDALLRACRVASVFAADQFATLWYRGLLDPERWADWQAAQPAWAMFWDFGFIAGWGYLLARLASRAFAWMAGTRDETSGAPAWRWLGMSPLAAVGGDVVEDLLTLLALAMDGIGAGPLRTFFLVLVGAAAAAKWLGLCACVPLVVVRLWIALPGVPRFRRSWPASGPAA